MGFDFSAYLLPGETAIRKLLTHQPAARPLLRHLPTLNLYLLLDDYDSQEASGDALEGLGHEYAAAAEEQEATLGSAWHEGDECRPRIPESFNRELGIALAIAATTGTAVGAIYDWTWAGRLDREFAFLVTPGQLRFVAASCTWREYRIWLDGWHQISRQPGEDGPSELLFKAVLGRTELPPLYNNIIPRYPKRELPVPEL